MKKNMLALALALAAGPLFSQNFTLKSHQIGGQVQNEQQFNGMGCSGRNLSPELYWENIPEGTLSFALNIYDPDAPTGSGFWHWVIFDIPADVTSLVEGAGNPDLALAPKGAVQSLNDYGNHGYGGPCPPQGDGIHQYLITVYALKVPSLYLERNTNPAMVGFNIWANTIEKTSMVMYYKR